MDRRRTRATTGAGPVAGGVQAYPAADRRQPAVAACQRTGPAPAAADERPGIPAGRVPAAAAPGSTDGQGSRTASRAAPGPGPDRP